MRKLHAALIVSGAVALVAGTAYAAAKYNTMNVALPDGSVAQITYEGDIAPKVRVVPAAQDPFAEMDRMAASMQARHEAIMRQSAEMQQQIQQHVERQVAAAQQGQAGRPGQVVISTNAPAGSHSFVSISSSTSGNGCTQTIETRSDGSGKEPQVTRTSSGDCGTTQKSAPAAPAPAKPEQSRQRVPEESI